MIWILLIPSSYSAPTTLICDADTKENMDANVLLNKFYEPTGNQTYMDGVKEITYNMTNGKNTNIIIQVNWVYMQTLISSNISDIPAVLDQVTSNFQKNNLEIKFQLLSSKQINETLELENCTTALPLYTNHGVKSSKVLNIFSGNIQQITGQRAFTMFPTLANNRVEGIYFLQGDVSLLTHEIGHWLGLLHTFNGGCDDENGDFVKDTPPTVRDTETMESYSWQCEIQRHTCPKQRQMDLIDNFMDYTMCGTSFTEAQRFRIMNFVYFRFNGKAYEKQRASVTDIQAPAKPPKLKGNASKMGQNELVVFALIWVLDI